jgi:ABC-type transport system substrate-binding protein
MTFHLRLGLKFQNGEPLNIRAVKLYIERAKEQKNSALAGDLTSIRDITADSETDVTLHLTQIDYAKTLQAATRVALQGRALVFTYGLPTLILKSPKVSDWPRIPGQAARLLSKEDEQSRPQIKASTPKAR